MKKVVNYKYIFVFCFLILMSQQAFCETIYLLSGKQINGEIVEDTENKVKVQVQERMLSIQKKHIARIGDHISQPTHFDSPPVSYIEKIKNIPDFLQKNVGAYFCVPVSVSNIFVWLDDLGFDNLVPNSGDRRKDHQKLAMLLSSAPYMQTKEGVGTRTSKAIKAIHRYIHERGYEYKRLEYQGWYRYARKFLGGKQVPDLEWVKHGILDYGAVWIIVGSYKYDVSKDAYYRLGGHWVTLVGYGQNKRGEEDPQILIIHNSAQRSGLAFSNDYVRAIQLKTGTLTGPGTGLPRSAVGYYHLEGKLSVVPGADTAIMDGAIILEMPTPVKNTNQRK